MLGRKSIQMQSRLVVETGLTDVRHSRPQSPRSFWSAPGIETSGRDRSRKSANHGLPAFVRSLRNLNNNGTNNGCYRLQKWAAIALARYLVPARGLDPWRRPKGSWALGTRMDVRGIGEPVSSLNSRSLYQAIWLCLWLWKERKMNKHNPVRVVFVLSASASAAAPAVLSYWKTNPTPSELRLS